MGRKEILMLGAGAVIYSGWPAIGRMSRRPQKAIDRTTAFLSLSCVLEKRCLLEMVCQSWTPLLSGKGTKEQRSTRTSAEAANSIASIRVCEGSRVSSDLV